jgi:pimeloyl-ACP methyl ester carboxylesterase
MLNHYRGGTGEPLVLIHGIGSRWQMWEPVLGRLRPHRDVIAIDLPGFASSPPAPPGTPPGSASLTDMVGDFLDELGVQRPHVAGNSLGGLIALELAKRGRTRSATGLSPAGFHTRGEARFERISLAASVRMARLLSPYAESLLSTGFSRTLMFTQLVGRPWRIPASQAVDSLRDLAGAPWFDDTLEALAAERFSGGAQIDVPVTVAWGVRDHLLLPRQAARAEGEIPGARRVMLDGCGHVPTWDDPAQVAEVLLAGSSNGR